MTEHGGIFGNKRSRDHSGSGILTVEPGVADRVCVECHGFGASKTRGVGHNGARCMLQKRNEFRDTE